MDQFSHPNLFSFLQMAAFAVGLASGVFLAGCSSKSTMPAATLVKTMSEHSVEDVSAMSPAAHETAGGSAADASSNEVASSDEIDIDNFTFSPRSISVPVGTTVTWVNRDDVPHTVVDTKQRYKSAALDTDDKFSFTFATPGEYSYFCGIHTHMTGTVIVK